MQQEWFQEFSDRRLNLLIRGLKFHWQGAIMAKNLFEIGFVPSNGSWLVSVGIIAP